jgi:alkyl sulfatase BDS1-like metallo-beta-lactamase superfamily hydrolase
MKPKFRLLALAAILALAVTIVYAAAAYEPEAVQAPAPFDPETVPVHPTLLSTYEAFFPPAIIEVTDGVYVARGYNRDNPALIEGVNGLIIVDPGESVIAAQTVKQAFNDHLDNIFDRKPVKAIIYTHEHDCHIHGAAVFADEKTVIYAHADMMNSLFNEWYSQIYPSRIEGGIMMSGLLFKHAPVQNGEGWYAGYVLSGPNLIGPSGFMPPTKLVRKELKTMIAGVELNLIPVAGETHDVLLVWLPRKDVLIEIGVLYEAFPALTTMRGSGQRNPLDYMDTLKLCRSLNPEYLVALHGAHPVTSGEENVREYLTNFSDAIQFMHDQTVQYMNAGYTPGEIMEILELPPHLASNSYLQETYGSKDWNIYHIFRYYRGYYTGEVRDLFPQSPMSEAQMSAELAGGIDVLAGKAADALADENYEWALRLADDALLLDPDNASAFETKKATLLALAEDTMNSQARNILLSDYLVMTDQIQVPVVLGDPQRTLSRMDPNIVRLMPMDTLHRIMAVNLNASKSVNADIVVGLQLTDIKNNDPKGPNHYRLNVRKGVLEIDPPSASGGEFVIVTDSLTWKQLVLYKLNPEEAVANGKVIITGGTPPSFYAFMGLFK